MPYSGANDASLPDHVKKMPEAVRNHWAGAFNGAMAICRKSGSADCEGYAFRVANAAIKERRMSMLARFKEWWGGQQAEADQVAALLEAAVTAKELASPPVLRISKDATGRYRWTAVVSNRFKDRDGEIIPEAAHLEFEKALDSGDAPMPELWFWHIPGSRLGQTDFFTYADGFVLASGTFDQEVYGERLAKMTGLGVSHGFTARKEGNVYSKYRDHEISPLPIDVAANPWTAFESGGTMAISDAKMKALTELVGDERAKAIAALADSANKELVAAGVEHKEVADQTAVLDGIKSLTDAVKSLSDGLDGRITTVVKAATDPLAAALATTQDSVTKAEKAISDLAGRVALVERTDDQKMADLLTPRAAVAAGYRASQAEDTKTTKEAAKEAGAPGVDWFAEVSSGWNDNVGVR